MYEPRLFSRSITILNPSIRTCFSSTCKALAPSWTGAFVSAMRLRFFDGRAASVSTGGIDNSTLSGSFGQPTAGSVAAQLWPTRRCMTPDRLCRGDCLRCRCEEDRAYVTSVVLPPRAVVRVLLRSWRDADPASVSAPQKGSALLKLPAFLSHIRRFASPAAQRTSCDDHRAG